MLLSKTSPEPGGESGSRHFPKQFTTGRTFQLWETLAEDGREVSACLQPASLIPPGLAGTRNAFSPCINSVHVLRQHKTNTLR